MLYSQSRPGPHSPLIPAKGGTQAFFGVFESRSAPEEKTWVPAFAGMSGSGDSPEQSA